MFRQFKIHPEDADLQRIVWRSDPLLPIKDYRLKTVTHATSPAPFLSLRTLIHLALDGKMQLLIASNLLKTQTYVDDIYRGGDNLGQALQSRNELIALLKSACI